MLAHLRASTAFTPRNDVFDFHDRRLVFLDGPGVVVELAEWTNGSAGQGASPSMSRLEGWQSGRMHSS